MLSALLFSWEEELAPDQLLTDPTKLAAPPLKFDLKDNGLTGMGPKIGSFSNFSSVHDRCNCPTSSSESLKQRAALKYSESNLASHLCSTRTNAFTRDWGKWGG